MKLANANIHIGDDFMAECSLCPSSQGCSKDKNSCMIENNPLNNVKKIIGVMSGKGGVGKSSVSVLIAKHLKQLGYSSYGVCSSGYGLYDSFKGCKYGKKNGH